MEQDHDTSHAGAAEQMPPQLGPSPEVRQVLYRAFAVGAIMIVGCIAIVAVAAMLLSAIAVPPAPSIVPVGTTAPVTATATPAASTVATTQAVPTLPANMKIVVTVDKTSAGNVIVYFNGGEGRSLIKQIEARLTRHDGTVVTGTMDPMTESPQITLAGTKGTDYLEVYALMYSGKRYLVLEQQVAPPVRAMAR